MNILKFPHENHQSRTTPALSFNKKDAQTEKKIITLVVFMYRINEPRQLPEKKNKKEGPLLGVFGILNLENQKFLSIRDWWLFLGGARKIKIASKS